MIDIRGLSVGDTFETEDDERGEITCEVTNKTIDDEGNVIGVTFKPV